VRRRALLAIVTVLVLAVPAAVVAAEVPRLADSVTDDAGVLSTDEEARVAASLDQLRDEHDVQLFVAFIDTTVPATAPDFAQSTADANSLGGNDALFLIAIGDRSDALWVGPSLEVTDDEIDAVLGVAEDRLKDGDFAGAVIAAAGALGNATVPAPVLPTLAPATRRPDPGVPEPQPSGGFSLVPVLAVLLILGGVFLLGRTFIVRRNAARADAAERDRLSREANRSLLATDECDADEEVDSWRPSGRGRRRPAARRS
jgi:uncharacterized membrane protein YgcG